MIPRHLLQHDNIGVGLVEKFVDSVDPVVAETEIESDDAEKALAVRRGFGGSTLQSRKDEPTLIAASSAAGTMKRQSRTKSARPKRTTVPAANRGSPLLMRSSAGHHWASQPRPVRTAPKTSPSPASNLSQAIMHSSLRGEFWCRGERVYRDWGSYMKGDLTHA